MFFHIAPLAAPASRAVLRLSAPTLAPRCIQAGRFYATAPPVSNKTIPATFQVFDREAKRLQRERAASDTELSRQVDYVKDEVAFRVVDRLLVE